MVEKCLEYVVQYMSIEVYIIRGDMSIEVCVIWGDLSDRDPYVCHVWNTDLLACGQTAENKDFQTQTLILSDFLILIILHG